MSIRHSLLALSICLVPATSFAAGSTCGSDVMAAMPVRPAVLVPVALELTAATTQLGGASGVLSQAFDEALSVDNVLLCGAGAARGGGVTGAAGHNAAMAVLELTGRSLPTDDD